MNWWRGAVLLGTGLGLHAPDLLAQSQDTIGPVARAAADTTTPAAAPTIPAGHWLARTLPASYSEPTCPAGTNHRKVKTALSSLKTAFEEKTPEERADALNESKRTLVEAIEKDKQERNTAAWYTLGKIYLYQDDVVGADSALRRGAELAPGCRSDFEELRYTAWASLMNGGIDFSKAKNNEAALGLFRKAAAIDGSKPHAAMNAGVLFANSGQLDSAVVYFRIAAKVAGAANMADERNRATFNLAAMLQQSSRHGEAAEALEQYIAWMPADNEAKQALVTSYRATGQTEKAQELEKKLLAAAGGQAGAGARDSAAAASDARGAAPVAADLAMRIGINFYNDRKYADAAAAFAKVLESEPNNRDAIYNLANAYDALKDGAKLVTVATRLVQIEPMSESALQLLGDGYQYANDIDKAVRIAEQRLALTMDVSVKRFITRMDGAQLTMVATGRAAQTPAGKSIPSIAVAMVIEFLDATGAVIAKDGADIPALKPNQTHEFVVEVKGRKIVAWRYTRK